MTDNRPFYPLCFLTLSGFLLIIILPLTRQGMFLDGVIYAALAKNLSLGHGTLWEPFYSQTLFPQFYEHPPLALYLESFFFKWFGQGFAVERIYSLLMALGQFFLISWFWVKQNKTSLFSINILLFLWLLIPLNHLYTQNMLEGTLTFFSTAASLVLLIKTPSRTGFFLLLNLSALAIILAFFCNGPTAFAPLATPFLRSAIEDGDLKKGFKHSLLLVCITVLFFSIFYYFVPEALSNTQQYFRQQLLPAVVGDRQLTYVGLKHFYIIYLFLRAYFPVSVFAIICIGLAAKLQRENMLVAIRSRLKNKMFLLFFLLALASSLPVGVSHRQAFNYIMPSSPFFTLAMMSFCYPAIGILLNFFRRKHWLKTMNYLSILFFIVSLGVVGHLANGFNRHKTMLQDIHYLTKYLKSDEVISTSTQVYYQWYTGAYFSRQAMISLTTNAASRYYLALKGEPIPHNYHLVALPLQYYNLAVQAH